MRVTSELSWDRQVYSLMLDHLTLARLPGKPTGIICLLLLLTSITTNSLASDIHLPEIGDPSGNLITPAEEQRFGQAFMRNIRSSMNVLADPLVESYIQSLGERLVEASNTPGRRFHFFLVDAPEINAFAGPSGYIGTYTGLITATQSESELASVLAHEAAHVSQQHLLRTFDAVQRMSLPMAALTVAAIVIGAAADNPDAGVAAFTGIQAGMAQRQINFTRAHEEEADRIGIQSLANAGFEPQAMATFFARMGKASRLYDSGQLPEFLRTHPVTSNRIADAYGRADVHRYQQRPDSLEYHLLRAKLRSAEFADPREAILFFEKSLNEGRFRNEEGQRYGHLLSLLAGRRYQEAKSELVILQKRRPQQVDYIVAAALIEKGIGHPKNGLEILREGLETHPGNYPLSIYYAQALLDHGDAAKVIPLLEEQIHDQPDNTTLYKLLAQAAGDSGNETQGRRYLSEYHYHSGDLQAAIKQLQQALSDRSIDYYQSAVMAARLKALRLELKELKERKKE
ncbi:MAG: M48 family metalloprotease [Candidatus Sedimenticola sp. (ex Thyasira tokunagai)]